MLTVLRLSTYQLLYLDRVPASAIVDDGVELVRAARQPRACGFVNAVLRTLARTRNELELPPRPPTTADREAMLDYLSITGSHPRWLVARWLDRYGFEGAERWVQFNNTVAPLTVRVHRRHASIDQTIDNLQAQGIAATRLPFAPHGLLVTDGRLTAHNPDEFLTVQDEASQLVACALGATSTDTVLDVCAAPGGKTTALADDMYDTGLLVACDIRPRRLQLLRSSLTRARVSCAHIVHIAEDGTLPFQTRFDRVLVDAPCSGLGTLRREPDIKWNRTEANLGRFAAQQRALLARAATVVVPGGRLVYATCSSEPEENEDVVNAFLEHHTEFSLVNLAHDDASLATLTDDSGRLVTRPDRHGLEAFFAAAFLRTNRNVVH